MRASWRIPLALLSFYGAVIAFTFAGTFLHEGAHAAAWDPAEAPDVRFEDDRDAASAALGQEKSLRIDGTTYRVIYVEETTIALYPVPILFTGATLGLAPGSVMPDTVLGSTFYAFDDADYTRLARDGEATSWHHSALPMIVNLVLTIPIWVWMLTRKSPWSMAAAWTSASEWRFNLHHAEEVGMPSGLYLAISLLIMAFTAAAIGFLAAQKVRQARSHGSRPEPSPGVAA